MKGFTLIELLIVIGVLAILSTAVVLILNPAQMLAQARDSQRISDLSSVKSAIALYLTTAVSPALTASTTCTVAGCINPFSNALALGSELFLNPGLETAGSPPSTIWANWVGASSSLIADETVNVHSGSHAAKLVSDGLVWYTPQIYENPLITVTPGQTYTWTFWTRGDGTNGGRYAVYNSVVGYILGQISTGNHSTTYSQVTYTFTAPAGCTNVLLWHFIDQVNGATAYFDDESLKQIISGVAPTVTTSTAVNGAGWVGGVDLTQMTGGFSPLATLPLDPINDSTYYYAYRGTTINTFKLAGRLESLKYQPKMVSDGGTQNICSAYTEPTCFYEVGTDLSL